MTASSCWRNWGSVWRPWDWRQTTRTSTSSRNTSMITVRESREILERKLFLLCYCYEKIGYWLLEENKNCYRIFGELLPAIFYTFPWRWQLHAHRKFGNNFCFLFKTQWVETHFFYNFFPMRQYIKWGQWVWDEVMFFFLICLNIFTLIKYTK